MDVEEVLGCQKCVFRKELQERNLLLGERCQLRDYLYLLQLAMRQLALHFKGADGVDVVAKEINAVGQLAAERVDVDDASTNSELPGLVNIIGLLEPEVAQGLLYCRYLHGLSYL